MEKSQEKRKKRKEEETRRSIHHIIPSPLNSASLCRAPCQKNKKYRIRVDSQCRDTLPSPSPSTFSCLSLTACPTLLCGTCKALPHHITSSRLPCSLSHHPRIPLPQEKGWGRSRRGSKPAQRSRCMGEPRGPRGNSHQNKPSLLPHVFSKPAYVASVLLNLRSSMPPARVGAAHMLPARRPDRLMATTHPSVLLPHDRSHSIQHCTEEACRPSAVALHRLERKKNDCAGSF